MIGIDRNTGRTISGWDQFVARVEQVMTTQIGEREKRRNFGSKLPSLRSKNMNNTVLMQAQSFAIDAFYNASNGISDFSPTSCVATRGNSGIHLSIKGFWNNETTQRIMEVRA